MVNWEAAGAIGEIVGAVAVIAKPGYLARQIRHSNIVASAQVYQERAAKRIAAHQLQATSEHLGPSIARLEEKGWPENVEAIEEPEGIDLYRFRQWQVAAIVLLDNSYHQYRLGFLDDSAW